MENLAATAKNLGVDEAIQAIIAFIMTWVSHLCDPGPAKKITFVLATGVLLIQWRHGWSKGQQDKVNLEDSKIRARITRVELEIVLSKLERECREDGEL